MKILSSALPFAGLGFDLAPLLSRACLMIWRRVPRSLPLAQAAPIPYASKAHGYGLMLRLSREIRGC